MFGQKMTAVPKLSYLHDSRLANITGTSLNCFNFQKLVLLKGYTFHLYKSKRLKKDS